MAHGEQIERRLCDADVGLDADEEDLERNLSGGAGGVGLREDARGYFGDELTKQTALSVWRLRSGTEEEHVGEDKEKMENVPC